MQEKKSRPKSKTRAWEKDRRDRINESFKKLSFTLPCYDPSKTLSKIEILDNATTAIKDLDDKVKNLLSSTENDKSPTNKLDLKVNIIRKLQDRIKKLLTRNEQLTHLLKTAGITIPTECSTIKKFTRRYKDKYKISVDRLAIVQKELEKENQVKNLKTKKLKTKIKQNVKNKKSSKKDSRRSKVLTSSNNCVFLVPQPGLINNPCYIIAKTPKKTNQTVITNSLLLKAPIVSSNIKPSIFSTNTNTTTDPMTLILTNGTLMPTVLPAQTPIIPSIITNPVQSTLIVVSSESKTTPITNLSNSTISNVVESKLDGNNVKTTTSTSSNLLGNRIRPILLPRLCTTKTTHVNKVPIPALTSRHVVHKCISPTKNNQTKVNESKIKNAEKTNKNKNKNGVISVPKKKAKMDKAQDVTTEQTKSVNVEDEGDIDNQEKEVTLSKEPVETRNVPTQEKDTSTPIKETQVIHESITNNQTVKNANNDSEKSVPVNGTTSTPSSNPIVEITGLEEILTIPTTVSTAETKTTEASTVVISTANDAAAKAIFKNHLIEPFEKSSTHSVVTSKEPPASSSSSSSVLITPIAPTQSNPKTSEVVPALPEKPQLITQPDHLKSMDINTEFSNDLFASLQVPTGCQNPESTSPTAAFLLAFPLVSSGVKVTEVIGDDNAESQQAGTPNLLQIGTMDSSKPTQSHSDSLTPGLLSLENFSFFGNTATTNASKDNCSGFYGTGGGGSGAGYNGNITSMAPSVPYATDIALPQLINKDSTINQSKTHLSKTKKSHNDSFAGRNNNNNNTSNYGMLNDKSTNIPKTEIKSHSIINHNNQLNSSHNLEMNVMHNATHLFQTKPPPLSNSNHYDTKSKSNQMLVPSSLPPLNRTFQNNSNYLNYKEPIVNSVYSMSNGTSGGGGGGVGGGGGTNNYLYNTYSTESAIAPDNNRSYNYSNFSGDYRRTDNFLPQYNNEPHLSYTKEKFNQQMLTNSNNNNNNNNNNKIAVQNKPINWMTTPAPPTSYKSDYFIPSFSKDNDFNSGLISNSYFGTQDHISTQDGKKSLDITLPPSQYGITSTSANSNSIIQYNQRTTVTTTATTTGGTHTDMEEMNQFNWSPNKIPQFLDPPAFVASTLPMLVGDLALNTMPPTIEQKPTTKEHRQRETKKLFDNHSGQSNFLSVSQLVEQQHNHNNSNNNRENVPAKVSSARRSSGNRSKHATSTKSKRTNNNNKTEVNMFQKTNDKSKHFGSLFCDNNPKQVQQMTHRNSSNNNKMVSGSSYSAEALIGNQLSSTNDISGKKTSTAQNRPIVSSFLCDNIMPYFPTVPDVPSAQDNVYMQSNQTYPHHPHHHQSNSFTHNFGTFQTGNGYSSTNNILPPSACAISSSYLTPNNNFGNMHNNQEFQVADNTTNLFHSTPANNVSATTKEKSNYGKNTNYHHSHHSHSHHNNHHHHSHQQSTHRQSTEKEEKPDSNTNNNNNNGSNCKKAKKRNYTDNALPPFDIPFLSLPGTINSPILPDDFHTTYLPPTTLYSCKNTLYGSKSGPDLSTTTFHGIPPPHPLSTVTAPAVGSNKNPATSLIQHPEISPPVGTSLANFNLCTIFPEINKGPIQESFPDMRNKNYSIRSFPPPPASIQAPFTGKPPITFGSFGT